MKTIEQKAKAYDEAKARMSRAFNSNRCTIGFMNEIFPEFRENWDEKIRTKLIEFFSGYNTDEEWWGSITEKDILAWLEKQGEHDSIEEPNFFDDFRNSDVEVDSNEDGLVADTIRCKIEKQGEQKPVKVPKFKVGDFIQFNGMGHTRYTIKEVCGLSHYINTCNKRMDMSYTDANFELVEPKQEWSEEDEKNMNTIINVIHGGTHLAYKNEIDWLKSLRPQSQWKPSEEQMIALKCAITTADEKWVCMNTKDLESLYKDLKKLKG